MRFPILAAFWMLGALAPISCSAAVVAQYDAGAGANPLDPVANWGWSAVHASPAFGNLAYPVENDLGTGVNAWQIADQSSVTTNPAYFKNLAAAEAVQALANGWTFRSSARYVFDFGDEPNLGMTAHLNGRTYSLQFDLGAQGALRATLNDIVPRSHILTAGGAGPIDYHDFALAFSPTDGMVAFVFDGVTIDRWNGLADPFADSIYWGNPAGGTQRGIMNYHEVAFEIADSSTPLPGDYDSDLRVDYEDYFRWRAKFASTDPTADGNHDGTVNAADYTVWRDHFAAGSLVPGDYNRDGQVNLSDYQLWKASFGSTAPDADGNRNGVVDAADYVVWRDKYVVSSSARVATSVPEVRWLTLLLLAGPIAGRLARRSGADGHAPVPAVTVFARNQGIRLVIADHLLLRAVEL